MSSLGTHAMFTRAFPSGQRGARSFTHWKLTRPLDSTWDLRVAGKRELGRCGGRLVGRRVLVQEANIFLTLRPQLFGVCNSVGDDATTCLFWDQLDIGRHDYRQDATGEQTARS